MRGPAAADRTTSQAEENAWATVSRHPALTYLTAGTLLLGLPLAGTWLAGNDLRQYLEFPPLTRYVEPAGFAGYLPFGLECLVLGDLVLTPLLPSRERP